MRIWLLRHGQSEWNAAGRWQGHGDPPLSDHGRATARDRAPEIAHRLQASGRPVRLYSSDLERARVTAGFVAEQLGVEVVAREDLRELDVGDWTGLSRDEIEAVEGARLAAFESEDPHVRPGGGETRGEIRLRVREVVERLADEHPDDDLLLVVHLGVVRALIPGAEPDHLDLYETTLEEIRRARSATSLGVPPR